MEPDFCQPGLSYLLLAQSRFHLPPAHLPPVISRLHCPPATNRLPTGYMPPSFFTDTHPSAHNDSLQSQISVQENHIRHFSLLESTVMIKNSKSLCRISRRAGNRRFQRYSRFPHGRTQTIHKICHRTCQGSIRPLQALLFFL